MQKSHPLDSATIFSSFTKTHISEVKRIKFKPCILDVEAQRTFLFQPVLSSKATE